MRTHRRGPTLVAWGVLLYAGVTLLSLSAGTPSVGQDGEESANEIFKQRILPIFRSSNPSSCTECHLAGVDLKDYISRDQAKTFASLREAGLVDTEKPDDSKILKLIQMKPEKPSPIAAEARTKEFEAFRAWIRMAVKDPDLVGAKLKGKPVGPSVSVEVIRHARRDRLLSSFIENIWSERQRCFNCHGPGEPPNPKGRKNKRKWLKEYGEETLIWMRGDDPEVAMNSILKSRIINLKQPEKSLMLTKPTQKVEHEGGKKMTVGDRAYRQFFRFIQDYAKIRAGKYRKETELPPSIKTRQWLRVRGVPSQRVVLMQVDFHRIEKGRWSRRPFATAIGGANKIGWTAPVEIILPRKSEEFEKINQSRKFPSGRYLLRFYVDTKNRLQRQPFYQFKKSDLTGELEISVDDWPQDRNENEAKMVQPKDRVAKEINFPRRSRR